MIVNKREKYNPFYTDYVKLGWIIIDLNLFQILLHNILSKKYSSFRSNYDMNLIINL